MAHKCGQPFVSQLVICEVCPPFANEIILWPIAVIGRPMLAIYVNTSDNQIIKSLELMQFLLRLEYL